MARYWRIYRTFIATSIVRELEFRANFVAKVLQNVVWLAFFVMILLVIYSNTSAVGGWGRGESFILAATIFVMTAFVNGFFFSLLEIPQQVRQGTLDFVVTKPVDSQFWISTRKFNFDQIGTLVAGLGLIGYGIYSSGLNPSPLQWMLYTVLLVASIVLFYSVNLILMATGIWFVRVDNLWILGENITQIARFPLEIYGVFLQRFFVFAVPLGFLAYVPTQQLVRGSDLVMTSVGVLWAALSLFAARWFWRFALKHYSSASS